MERTFVHEYFKRTAEAFAGHVAVSCGNRELSFEQLDSASDRMAVELIDRGCGIGSIIGVYLEPGIEYVVSIIAILKTGGIYLPLSIDFPPSRLAAVLGLAEAGFIVTGARFESAVGDLLRTNPQVKERFGQYIIDKGPFDGGAMSTRHVSAKMELAKIQEKVQLDKNEHDACYLISTSGSTGEPKAIMGSHRGLCHFIAWEIREFKLERDTRVSWLSHPTFDVSLRDIFVPLCCGGTLVIPEERVRSSPKALYRWLEDKAITLTHVVPTLFRLLTEAIAGQQVDGRVLVSLKYALIAGEPLHGFDVIRWIDVVGDHTRLVNLYGPSETTLAKLFYPIDVSRLEPNTIVPLGKPIPGARAYILKDDRICDIDEEGEICIETQYRSHGYYRNPEMTSRAFVKNPIDPESQEPIYRTGDLGKLLKDGNIQFVGRADRQVKLRGVRVELGEIETILSQNPKVELAAASVDVDEKGNQRLIAYLVPKSGEELYVESLRAFMAERLPEYMNPNIYIILDSLPLTPSGKIDRMSLPAPGMIRPHLKQGYASATNLLEEKLVHLWREALGLEQVGIDDNFFDLGGNSILAAKLAEMVSGYFHVDLPVVKLFEFPKIRLLAKFFSQEALEESPSDIFERRARQRRSRRMPSADS
jgi:amino acid adenylation domain-containing protein